MPPRPPAPAPRPPQDETRKGTFVGGPIDALRARLHVHGGSPEATKISPGPGEAAAGGPPVGAAEEGGGAVLAGEDAAEEAQQPVLVGSGGGALPPQPLGEPLQVAVIQSPVLALAPLPALQLGERVRLAQHLAHVQRVPLLRGDDGDRGGGGRRRAPRPGPLARRRPGEAAGAAVSPHPAQRPHPRQLPPAAPVPEAEAPPQQARLPPGAVPPLPRLRGLARAAGRRAAGRRPPILLLLGGSCGFSPATGGRRLPAAPLRRRAAPRPPEGELGGEGLPRSPRHLEAAQLQLPGAEGPEVAEAAGAGDSVPLLALLLALLLLHQQQPGPGEAGGARSPAPPAPPVAGPFRPGMAALRPQQLLLHHGHGDAVDGFPLGGPPLHPLRRGGGGRRLAAVQKIHVSPRCSPPFRQQHRARASRRARRRRWRCRRDGAFWNRESECRTANHCNPVKKIK